VKGSTPWLFSSRITTLVRTDRGKPLNASVKLVFGWKIEPAAFSEEVTYSRATFCPLSKRDVLRSLITESQHFVLHHLKRDCFI
jgi:hypothetical protein